MECLNENVYKFLRHTRTFVKTYWHISFLAGTGSEGMATRPLQFRLDSALESQGSKFDSWQRAKINRGQPPPPPPPQKRIRIEMLMFKNAFFQINNRQSSYCDTILCYQKTRLSHLLQDGTSGTSDNAKTKKMDNFVLSSYVHVKKGENDEANRKQAETISAV